MRRALVGPYAALDAQRGRVLALAVPNVVWKRLAKARERRMGMVATVVYGVLTVCAVALVAVAGLEVVQRLVPAPLRQEPNDVAGFISGAAGAWPFCAVALAGSAARKWGRGPVPPPPGKGPKAGQALTSPASGSST